MLLASRSLKVASNALSLAIVMLAGTAAMAATSKPLKIEFLPPKVEPANICVQRATDEDIVKRWSGWDRQKLLPDAKEWVILREAQRLRIWTPLATSTWLRPSSTVLANGPDLTPSDVVAEKNSVAS